MKSLWLGLLLMCAAISTPLSATTKFNSEYLKSTSDLVIILTKTDSYSGHDMITAYDETGEVRWELSFDDSIISWKLKSNYLGKDYLYVLTKKQSSYQNKNKLTCIDPTRRDVLVWEKKVN